MSAQYVEYFRFARQIMNFCIGSWLFMETAKKALSFLETCLIDIDTNVLGKK